VSCVARNLSIRLKRAFAKVSVQVVLPRKLLDALNDKGALVEIIGGPVSGSGGRVALFFLRTGLAENGVAPRHLAEGKVGGPLLSLVLHDSAKWARSRPVASAPENVMLGNTRIFRVVIAQSLQRRFASFPFRER
jgi:hypothetical protein